MCPSPLSPVCQLDQVLHVEAPIDQLVHGARLKRPHLLLQIFGAIVTASQRCK